MNQRLTMDHVGVRPAQVHQRRFDLEKRAHREVVSSVDASSSHQAKSRCARRVIQTHLPLASVGLPAQRPAALQPPGGGGGGGEEKHVVASCKTPAQPKTRNPGAVIY